MIAEPLVVSEQVTEYTLNAVPQWAAPHDWYAWQITVVWRGPDDLWAVLHLGYCLAEDGTWDYEPGSSHRTDDWKRTHRFGLEQALSLARDGARTVVVNGWTPAAIIAEALQKAGEDE